MRCDRRGGDCARLRGGSMRGRRVCASRSDTGPIHCRKSSLRLERRPDKFIHAPRVRPFRPSSAGAPISRPAAGRGGNRSPAPLVAGGRETHAAVPIGRVDRDACVAPVFTSSAERLFFLLIPGLVCVCREISPRGALTAAGVAGDSGESGRRLPRRSDALSVIVAGRRAIARSLLHLSPLHPSLSLSLALSHSRSLRRFI